MPTPLTAPSNSPWLLPGGQLSGKPLRVEKLADLVVGELRTIEITDGTKDRGIDSVGIAARIRERIESGEFASRDWLPSETDLAQTYGVGRDTVRAALALLREERLITTIKGRGSFVS